MKITLAVLLCCAVVTLAIAGDQTTSRESVVIQKLRGDVTVRHGVTEVWATVAPGDVLRPDDSMKIGKNGTALLVVNLLKEGTQTVKRINLPPEVIVDISDIRNLSPEELMLKLTMEKVRASSYQWRNDELQIPNTSVVHGRNEDASSPPKENDPRTGELQLNGARVLYNNGFYSTCALKTMELFRLYPPLGERFENRLMMADALAQADLRSEALTEYSNLARTDGLTSQQQSLVDARIAKLRK